ncbi:MAG TPA: M23 family metallopeptidase [Candidatus Aphodocola excrementigallinarum]|uniref:M23 family metallopeptidase n=1 Tax=Candidatus Aphodocola excrementigallinarum TaxID=2840670 RepID=A0A9D1IMQ6_9FIRM|nr:M23 family metallopeptidase [Candidatus Aphodocola excrementigallinarum]
MKKRKLKPFVKVTIISVLFVAFVVTAGVLTANQTMKASNMDNDYVYVNDYIFDSYYPVVNQDEKIQRPYQAENISVYKNFYEEDASEEEQQNSIIYHEGIYMQNSGVDYKSDESFDVLSSLSGTVTDVKEDSLLGNTIEIRNSSEVVMLYQCLSDVSVKKGDTITQGQVIAKSGTCELNKDVKNGLHFEMYKNGTVINPEKYYDKSVKELTDN